MVNNSLRKLFNKKIIGRSTHSVKEAMEAEREGADYIGVGPIFATDTKPDAAEPVGTELIRKVKEAVKIPQVAIGGINEENLQDVIGAGAKCVAMVSAIVTNDDISGTVRRINGRFEA